MEITIQPINTASDDALLELSAFLSRIFPKTDKFNFEFLKWQYRECPDGAMIGFNAYDGTKLISHFAALPLKMSIFGSVYKGAACMNVSTDSDYRGKMLFTKLGQATIDYAKQYDFDFLVAVPNANSTHAFLKYFDFKLISPLTVKVGFGLPKYRQEIAPVFKVWNSDLLDWRIENPANKYFVYQNQIQTPISFFAKTVNLKTIDFKDNIIKLPKKPISLFAGLGVDFGATFFNLPKWIKRPPFNLVFKDLTNGKLENLKKEDFFIQLIDLDII